ncbi:l-iditol 2-dehydrogenase [Nannochloropsis gaditana]|uniref:L-iditol 2-dehydrogenase n=1 Tax=Nannochloropsis gaditana TaxID=72520 RepID=W7TSP5_9STRA|nr:l-iditol 2-dehydrogenase [Nannochloropsis gaditana]
MSSAQYVQVAPFGSNFSCKSSDLTSKVVREMASTDSDNMQSSLQSQNPAAYLLSINKIAVKNYELPSPLGEYDVRIAIKAVGICASDVHYLRRGRIADFIVKEPMVIGHESAGEVVAVGKKVTNLVVGDRVAIEPGIACQRCPQCKTGAYNLCPDMRFFATPPVHGSLARFVQHPANLCFPLPASISYEEGAMCEPFAVGVYACTKAKVRPGIRLLITGAGPIGLVTLLAARAFGASDIIITDVDRRRLAIAAEIAPGTRTVLVEGKAPTEVLHMVGGCGCVDVTMDCAGFEGTVELALEATANGGKVLLIGMGCSTRRMHIPLLPAAIREVDLLGSFRYRNVYPACLAMIASGKVDLKRLITHYKDLSGPGSFTAESVTSGFALSEQGGEVVKVMFTL